MASAGTVTVDFAAETAKFTAELKKVNEKLTGVQSGFKTLETVAKGALGFHSVSVFTSFIKESVAAADALGDVAEQIGISVTALSQLQFAAQESDVEVEQLNKSLVKMSINVSDAFNGVSSAQKSLAAFGLTASELRGLKLEDQLAKIADQFVNLVPPADRVRAVTDLFGKGAEKLIPLLLQGSAGLKEFADEADRLGISLDEHAIKSIDRATKTIDKFLLSLKRVTANIVGDLLDPFIADTAEDRIAKLTEKVRELNLVKSETPEKFTIFQKIDLENSQLKLDQLTSEISKRRELADAISAEAQALQASREAEANAEIRLPDVIVRPRGGISFQEALDFEIQLDDALIAQERAMGEEIAAVVANNVAMQTEEIRKGEEEQASIRDFYRQYALERELEFSQQQIAMKQGVVNSAIGLLQALAGRSKAAAIAMIAVQKAFAIGEAMRNTAVAVTNALASVPYPLNIAAAANMKALGAIQIGLIAATGLVQAANVGSGGAALGSVANPVFTNNTSTSLTPEERPTAKAQRTTQVIFNGPIYNTDDFQRSVVVDALKEVSERDVIVFSGSSAQAQVIRSA